MNLYLPTSLDPKRVIETINCLRNMGAVRDKMRGVMSAQAYNSISAEQQDALRTHYVERVSLVEMFGDADKAIEAGRDRIELALKKYMHWLEAAQVFLRPLPIKVSDDPWLPPHLAAIRSRPRAAEFSGKRSKWPRTTVAARRLLYVVPTASEDEIFEALLTRIESVHPDYFKYGGVEAFAVADEWRDAFYSAWEKLVPGIPLHRKMVRTRRLSHPRPSTCELSSAVLMASLLTSALLHLLSLSVCSLRRSSGATFTNDSTINV